MKRPRRVLIGRGTNQTNPPNPPEYSRGTAQASSDALRAKLDARQSIASLRTDTSGGALETAAESTQARQGIATLAQAPQTSGDRLEWPVPERWLADAEVLVLALRSALILDPDLKLLRTPAMRSVLAALERAETSLDEFHDQLES